MQNTANEFEIPKVTAMFSLDLSPNADWKQRYRARRVLWSTLARHCSDRGILCTISSDGVYQIFSWEPALEIIQQRTFKPQGVTQASISPDGEYIYYLSDEKGGEEGHFIRVPFVGGIEEDITPNLPLYSVVGHPSFSGDSNLVAFTYADSGKYNVSVVYLGSPDFSQKTLYSSKNLAMMPILSDNGSIIVFGSLERTNKQADLYALDILTGSTLEILESSEHSDFNYLSFSPINDDERVLGTQNEDGYTRPFLWNIKMHTKESLTVGNFDCDILPVDWMPNASEILLAKYWNAEEQLHVYAIKDEVLRRLPHQDGSFSFVRRGGRYFRDDQIFITFQNATKMGRIVSMDVQTGAMCDALSLDEVPKSRSGQSIAVTSSDGTPVQSWLATPNGSAPYPLIINIHGGPELVSKNSFSPFCQAFLDIGCAVLSINYRGSITFGTAFRAKIIGNPGTWELEDIIATRNWVINQGIAHPDKILLFGSSYGGYLVLHCLGKHPDLWAGGISKNGIADWALTYEHQSSAMQGYISYQFGGTPDEKSHQYLKSSPIHYAENIQAPILLFQGKKDSRVPPLQMERFEEKLLKLGKDFEIYWTDAGHRSSFAQVDESIKQQEHMLQFASRLLK